jgi:Ca2+-binding RTX toxin-like protein
MIGINLAGAEFGSARGTYGYSYIYPNAGELDYFKSEGVNLIRLPFLWERVQPVLGGPLDSAEVGRIHTFLDQAAARGMEVVLDVHNYGRYDKQMIGSEAVPIQAFADFWSRMATEFGGDPAIAGFGLMNEPHDMGGPNVWPAAAQAATDAIRAAGATENIIVAGDGWSSAGMWQQVNGNLAVQDALNKIVYEAHIYFDRDNSGTYRGTYDQEGVNAMTAVKRLEVFATWLAEHNAKGFIGEFGVPAGDPRWLTALDNFVDAMHALNMDGTAWAAGPWWGNYPLSLEPGNGQDKPQLAVLMQYAFDAPAASLAADAIDENMAGALIGDIVLSRDGVLTDGAPKGLSFALSDARFEVVSDVAGHHVKLVDGISLDFEAASDIALVVTVTNALGYSTSRNVTVHVHDVLGNTITGSSGNDIIDLSHSAPGQKFASSENDVIYGMAGSDTIIGGAAADWIDGGAGIDTASYASSSAGVRVSLATGTGQGGDAEGDTLVNIENLTGSAFNDFLEGNSAANRLNGGAGIDTVSYEHSSAGVTVSLASTVAQVSGGNTNNDAAGDVLTSIENLFGSAFDDTLTGNSLANILSGGAGNDTLNGGTGMDTMIGGTGDDTYVVDNAGDLAIENPFEGIDTVRASTSYRLGDNVENLTLLGAGNINGTGNDLANVLIGSSGKNNLSGLGGNDALYGQDGDDTLIGGAGADWLDGGNGLDTASYASSSGAVHVSLLAGLGQVMGGDAEGDTLVNIENLTGSAFDDVFEGNGAANRFDGGAGIDTVSYAHSGAGVSVSLIVSTAQASTGDANGDALVGIENLTGSAFDDRLTGNSMANTLNGGAGNDVLDGWSGTDTMIGGAGDDTYFVDNAGDQVIEYAQAGIDTVRTSGNYTLGDNVENLTLLNAGNFNGTGNAADNAITGNAGNNVLSGLDGNDTLTGGAGRDTLIGGDGDDTFVFAAGFGKDTILDFDPGSDVLQFGPDVFANAAQVMADSTQVGADVVIAYDAFNTVTLTNTVLANLQAQDFYFG